MTDRRIALHPWTRVNLVLAGLLALLVATDHLARETDSRRPLTALGIDGITAVRVEDDARLRLAARRAQGGWRLVHPQDQTASPRRIAQLLAVARAPVHYAFAAPAELAPYGLDPPAAVVRFEHNTGEAVTLAFGDRDPDQRHRYVLVGNAISLIDEAFFGLLSLPPHHFVTD